MPSAALDITDEIIGIGLISAETIAQELRERLVRDLADRRHRLSDWELLDHSR